MCDINRMLFDLHSQQDNKMSHETLPIFES